MPSSWSVLEQAHAALRSVIAQVGEADWTLPTPCTEWNVAQVLRHAAGDQRGYAAAITGTDGPAENPFAPSDTRPDDPRGFLDGALSAAQRAFATVAPGTPEVPCPLPLGPLPAETVVDAAALDAVVHAWDIAVATDRPSPLTAEVAAHLMPVAETIAGPLRAFAFGPAIDPRPGDDAAARLLRFLGRTPTA